MSDIEKELNEKIFELQKPYLVYSRKYKCYIKEKPITNEVACNIILTYLDYILNHKYIFHYIKYTLINIIPDLHYTPVIGFSSRYFYFDFTLERLKSDFKVVEYLLISYERKFIDYIVPAYFSYSLLEDGEKLVNNVKKCALKIRSDTINYFNDLKNNNKYDEEFQPKVYNLTVKAFKIWDQEMLDI